MSGGKVSQGDRAHGDEGDVRVKDGSEDKGKAGVRPP